MASLKGGVKSWPSQRGEGNGETWYRATTEIMEHILIIALHSVSVMGLSFVILMVATLQGNQYTLPKPASIHP